MLNVNVMLFVNILTIKVLYKGTIMNFIFLNKALTNQMISFIQERRLVNSLPPTAVR